MAYAEIKPIHRWKGKTVFQTLFDVIDYATNENKTTYVDKNNVTKILAERYECGKNAAEEWDLIKSEYKKITGRSQGDKDILAHRIIQSFDPKDNIDPELANKIGNELASRLTNGEFSFIVGTHLDKEHIHNHPLTSKQRGGYFFEEREKMTARFPACYYSYSPIKWGVGIEKCF